MNDAVAADLFDGAAAQYDTDLFHSTVAHALIDSLADVARPRLVLDVATGTGVAAFAALRLAPERIFAVDIAPGMIARAKDKASKYDPDGVITWKVAPAVPAPAEAEGCDVVVCASSLHFLGMDALRDWLRMLRPGGRVAFSLPDAATFRPSPALATLVSPSLSLPHDEQEAAAFAADSGFVEVTARRIHDDSKCSRSTFLVGAAKPA